MIVTIIGGGMAGATLALALSYLNRDKLQINLVEAQHHNDYDHLKFGTRSIVLAHGTRRELNTIGIWPALASHATKISRIEISEKGYFGKIKIKSEEYKLSSLGYVLELKIINKVLFDLLNQACDVQLYYPAKLIQLKREYETIIITLDNGTKIKSQLIVAADGSLSSLASKCGIQYEQHDYQQTAIISNITTTISHSNCAFEKFTNQGSLALLPTSNGCSALVWCLPTVLQKDINNLNDRQFCYALQNEFGWRLGHIISTSTRQYYPLFLQKARRHITHRVALIGNAAQTLHPIAAQGFNLGLRDVMTLAEIITQAAAQGEDIGKYDILLRYQQRRQFDQANMISITNGLIHLFSNHYLPLAVIRKLGLLAMSHIPFLRNMLAHKMLGWVYR